MAGPATGIRRAVKLLQRWGPERGYYPEPEKSIAVCDPAQLERVQYLLRKHDFRYETGARYVGGFLGTDISRDEWLAPQIQQWVYGVKQLAKVARRYPQTAYAGLAKSLQSEWQYLQRVTSGIDDAFAPVEKAIKEEFLPALFDLPKGEIAAMRDTLALPVRCAGLGLPDPTKSGQRSYTTSTDCTAALTSSLLEGSPFDVLEYLKNNGARREGARTRKAAAEGKLGDELLAASPTRDQRRIKRARETGAWISTMPNRLNGTELSAEEFRDSLRLRYGLQPAALPTRCDGCQSRFSVEHGLSCKKGGLITLRHNEVAGEFGRMCAQALTPSAVSDEPLIPTSQDRTRGAANGRTTTVEPETRGDIAVRGFWKRCTTAIFDVRVTDTDAPSYRSAEPKKLLERHEEEKKRKYLEPCLASRRQFTPLVFSVDGLQGKEARAASQRLATLLSGKWKRAYSEMCGFVRSRLSLALVRATSLCLRGSRDPTAQAPAFSWDSGHGVGLY